MASPPGTENVTVIPIFHDWHDLPQAARGASVALGNFDGVHLGHAQVIAAAHAARPDAPLAVLTFEPHPREVFRPDDPPFRLTPSAMRARLLAAHGVRLLYEIRFDRAFSDLSAEAFIDEVLAAGLGARHLACGPDFAFGHRRGGDVALLAARAEALSIGLSIVPPLADAEGRISSSRIRRLLRDGYPERASALLGRPFAIAGVVAHGDERGRLLGFPTANLPLGRALEPARGVYAVTVTLADGRRFGGVANLGRRPTLGGDPETRLEAHLFEFEGNLYDETIEVGLIAYLREERKFPDLAALQAQISADAACARAALDHAAAASA